MMMCVYSRANVSFSLSFSTSLAHCDLQLSLLKEYPFFLSSLHFSFIFLLLLWPPCQPFNIPHHYHSYCCSGFYVKAFVFPSLQCGLPFSLAFSIVLLYRTVDTRKVLSIYYASYSLQIDRATQASVFLYLSIFHSVLIISITSFPSFEFSLYARRQINFAKLQFSTFCREIGECV